MKKTILINTLFVTVNLCIACKDNILQIINTPTQQIMEEKKEVATPKLIENPVMAQSKVFHSLVLECRNSYYKSSTTVDKIMAARNCLTTYEDLKVSGLQSEVMNNFLEKNMNEIVSLISIKYIRNDFN